MAIRKEFLRSLRNKKYEATSTGIFMPEHKILLGGVFGVTHRRNGEIISYDESHNILVNQGLNHVLDVVLHGSTPVATWYIGLFEANYTPQATDTAANIAANSTETTAYDESTRVAYVEAAASSQSTTNSASPATFTANDTKTWYGGFLVSTSTKGGTAGTLLSAAAFTASKAVVDDDQLLITYTFSAADA